MYLKVSLVEVEERLVEIRAILICLSPLVERDYILRPHLILFKLVVVQVYCSRQHPVDTLDLFWLMIGWVRIAEESHHRYSVVDFLSKPS